LQVARLVGLLAPLFPTKGPDGQRRVVPYHKSVLDWLDPSSVGASSASGPSAAAAVTHVHSVDVGAGHKLLAGAAVALVFATGSAALEATSARLRGRRFDGGGDVEGRQLGEDELPALALEGGRYALRHAVAHACLAIDAAGGDEHPASLLDGLLLQPGFWQQAFGAGGHAGAWGLG